MFRPFLLNQTLSFWISHIQRPKFPALAARLIRTSLSRSAPRSGATAAEFARPQDVLAKFKAHRQNHAEEGEADQVGKLKRPGMDERGYSRCQEDEESDTSAHDDCAPSSLSPPRCHKVSEASITKRRMEANSVPPGVSPDWLCLPASQSYLRENESAAEK